MVHSSIYYIIMSPTHTKMNVFCVVIFSSNRRT